MKGVTCRFEGYGREYSFMLRPDLEVELGDRLLAEAAGKVAVVVVTGLSPVAPKMATKWAFQKVDVAELERLKVWKMEQDQLEERRWSITARLNRKLESRSSMERYREMAKDDPEAAALLAELQSLEAGR